MPAIPGRRPASAATCPVHRGSFGPDWFIGLGRTGAIPAGQVFLQDVQDVLIGSGTFIIFVNVLRYCSDFMHLPAFVANLSDPLLERIQYRFGIPKDIVNGEVV